MAIIRNAAGQGVYIYAHNATADAPKTGDAANITAKLSKGGSAWVDTATVNPSEIGRGVYWYPLSQAETDTGALALMPVSGTGGVAIDPVLVMTQDAAIASRAVAGDAMTIAANAITSSEAPALAYLDAAVSTRLASASYSAAPSASDNAAAAAAAILAMPANKLATDPKGVASANVTRWNDSEPPDLGGLDGLDGSTLALEATAQAILVRTGLIMAGGSVTAVAPVASDGATTVYQGDDYAATDGRALEWSAATWPDLTNATMHLMVRAQTGALFSKAGTVVSAGGATQTIRVELTDDETALLEAWPAASVLRIRATLASGNKVTLVDSTLSVIEEVS